MSDQVKHLKAKEELFKRALSSCLGGTDSIGFGEHLRRNSQASEAVLVYSALQNSLPSL